MKINQDTNKLILIGNGFDLAHDLKTSYSEFLLWYINKAIVPLRSFEVYDDILIKLTPKDDVPKFSINTLDDFNRLITKRIIDSNPKNDFIKNIIGHHIEYNWVDIENQYYSSLTEIFDAVSSGLDLYTINDLKKLNVSFDYIKELLQEYLSTIPKATVINDEIRNNFLYEFQETSESRRKDQILFLNFNYTSTIELYKDYWPIDLNIKINYIHGKLGDPRNPIIFGYGDEMDSYYEKIEQLNKNEFTKHMKSFDYLKTRNYQDFLRFIESNTFDVFIMGHSCGLSDRILLNTIFEHPNCKNIKIYYYQQSKVLNDFTEKTQEISRHFKPSFKAEMRKKIVPFEDCKPLITQY